MAEYRLSPRAERDLKEIWNYTAAQWSVAQAESYVDSLIDTMELLAEEPSRGRSAEEIRSSYMRRNVGAHVIFYRQTDYGIAVVRILHGRMDFESQLGSD